MGDFAGRFTELTLPEKVRVAGEARRRGFVIVPLAEEVAGLRREAIEVIPAAELTEAHFPGADQYTLEELRSYYSVAEKHQMYPPLGYAPELRSEEREAAALLSYMVSTVENWGEDTIEEYGYPIARLWAEPQPSSEEEIAEAHRRAPKLHRRILRGLTSLLR